MISALEHYSYCPRQCGLIHVEGTFTENVRTVRGEHAHERAHEEGVQTTGEVRIARSLPVWSDRLGLIGKADIVEFRGDQPYPVEYKVGRRKRWGHEDIQLGAQALCLEEMLGVSVPQGAIFYRGSQRRREVAVDANLRALVERTTEAVRALLAASLLPPAVDDARCPSCSLNDPCLPGAAAHPRRARLYAGALFHAPVQGGQDHEQDDTWSF